MSLIRSRLPSLSWFIEKFPSMKDLHVSKYFLSIYKGVKAKLKRVLILKLKQYAHLSELAVTSVDMSNYGQKSSINRWNSHIIANDKPKVCKLDLSLQET